MPRLTSPADYGKFDRLDDPDSDSIVNETDPGLVLDSNEDRASPLATIVVSLAPWDTLSRKLIFALRLNCVPELSVKVLALPFGLHVVDTIPLSLNGPPSPQTIQCPLLVVSDEGISRTSLKAEGAGNRVIDGATRCCLFLSSQVNAYPLYGPSNDESGTSHSEGVLSYETYFDRVFCKGCIIVYLASLLMASSSSSSSSSSRPAPSQTLQKDMQTHIFDAIPDERLRTFYTFVWPLVHYRLLKFFQLTTNKDEMVRKAWEVVEDTWNMVETKLIQAKWESGSVFAAAWTTKGAEPMVTAADLSFVAHASLLLNPENALVVRRYSQDFSDKMDGLSPLVVKYYHHINSLIPKSPQYKPTNRQLPWYFVHLSKILTTGFVAVLLISWLVFFTQPLLVTLSLYIGAVLCVGLLVRLIRSSTSDLGWWVDRLLFVLSGNGKLPSEDAAQETDSSVDQEVAPTVDKDKSP